MLFSERNGLNITKELQIASMDKTLRIRLWNCLDNTLLHFVEGRRGYSRQGSGDPKYIWQLFKKMWDEYFERPLHEFPVWFKDGKNTDSTYIILFAYVQNSQWYRVFDFFEWILRQLIKDLPNRAYNKKHLNRLNKRVNEVLRAQRSVFRLLEGKFIQLVEPIELEEVEQVFRTDIDIVKEHLTKAVAFFSDRENPDYKNSIKESISAVEAICKYLLKDEKIKGNPTLKDCLKELRKRPDIHQTFITAVDKFYAYTNGEEGIRHSNKEDGGKVTESEARFSLVTCSAIVNYLLDRGA